MNTITTIKKRSFTLENISEEEGLVLRTLLNLNENGVKERLLMDKSYWDDDMTEDEAVEIGTIICNKIMNLVDFTE